MKRNNKTLHEIKYNKFQAISFSVVTLAIIEPIRRLIIQAINFHEYYWFLLCFIMAALVFWNCTRLGIMALVGVPALVLTTDGITLTQKGYMIEWDDIDEINLMESRGRSTTYTLAISVKDDWKYIGSVRNPIFRYYRWYFREYYNYTPFSVSLSILDENYADIYAVVENSFHSYRSNELTER